MGHSHGVEWTNEMIEDEIKKSMIILGIERMPSNKEVILSLGNHGLSNKISKTGGFYHWARKLNLEIKGSETKLGVQKEKEISEFINNELKWSSELTPVKFPYDILIERCIKVDVKYSGGYNYEHGFYYSFNLEYEIPKCDLLVLVCGCEKTIIMPSHIMYGKKQVSIGSESKYDKYKDRWDLIKSMHENICNLDSQ